jgi:hypothetical protein
MDRSALQFFILKKEMGKPYSTIGIVVIVLSILTP